MRSSLDVHAGALARAFHEDPATRYLLPNPVRRAHVMRFTFGCYLRYGERAGVVDRSPAGAAIWLREAQARLCISRLVRSGFAAAPLVVGVPALRRMARFGHAIDELHRHLISEAHWYLFILGAEPAGAGAGSCLLAPGLGCADQDGLPCYLEISAPRALPFYLRHGFEVVGESEVPGGPHLWALLRPIKACV